jgi:hypothetical protein
VLLEFLKRETLSRQPFNCKTWLRSIFHNHIKTFDGRIISLVFLKDARKIKRNSKNILLIFNLSSGPGEDGRRIIHLMKRLWRAAAIILGILGLIAGLNLGVPAIGRLVRYSIYARPGWMESMPVGAAPPISPVSGLVVKALLGLILATAGITLLRHGRYHL